MKHKREIRIREGKKAIYREEKKEKEGEENVMIQMKSMKHR
jgi:hypothetical protein